MSLDKVAGSTEILKNLWKNEKGKHQYQDRVATRNSFPCPRLGNFGPSMTCPAGSSGRLRNNISKKKKSC